MKKAERNPRNKNQQQAKNADFDVDNYLMELRKKIIAGQEPRRTPKPQKLFAILVVPVLILLAALALIINPSLIGFVSLEKEYAYNDSINKEFTSNSEYSWELNHPGNLKSIRLHGQYSNGTKAKIYIENENLKYLILDLEKMKTDGAPLITAFAVNEGKEEKDNKTKDKDSKGKSEKDGAGKNAAEKNESEAEPQELNETISNETSANETFQTPLNETADEVPSNETQRLDLNQTEESPSNETTVFNKSISKSISVKLEYNKNTPYDDNDDGTESTANAIDFTVDKSSFSWNYDTSKLCTRWEIYSFEDEKITTACYGNESCCANINLLPARNNWNDTLYLSYNSLGATSNNIVSARVIYADDSEIALSGWANLNAKFEEYGLLGFGNICSETCAVFGFNKSNYNLVIEVEGGKLVLVAISYAVSSIIPNSDPILIKNISSLNIRQGRNITVSLDEHFFDADGDNLQYHSYKADNLSIEFKENKAIFTPDNGFEGVIYTFITANDSEGIAISNIFALNVTKSRFKPKVELGSPVRWQNIISIDLLNAASANLTLPERAANVSVRIIDNGIEKEISKDKIRVLEGGKEKSIDSFELDNKIENIEKKINLLNEAKNSGASKIAIDAREINADEIDSRLTWLQNEKSELSRISSSASIVGITGNVAALSEAAAEPQSESSPEEQQTMLVIDEKIDPNAKIEVNYETEAPVSIENEINSYTKQIKIVSETPYEDVLSYTSLNDAPKGAIRLYWIKNETKELFADVDYLDENSNGLVDRIEWIIPHLSNQTFEVAIIVLNVQSYPTVGGSWTVAFNTTGTGNLTIIAFNGTTYAEKENDDAVTLNDLNILELKCNVNALEPLYIVELGNLSLEGLTAISGNVVEEIDKNKISLKENKENGFHSLTIAPRPDLLSPRTIGLKQNLFKYLSVENEETKLGSHSLAIAADSGSAVLHEHAGSNSLSNEMNLPPPASKNLLNKKFNNENPITNLNNQNKISDFFSIIPSVSALHIGSGTYSTINFNGQTYALLTKEQLTGHSYKIIGVYYQDYNCDNLTGYWAVKVLTAGVHNQRFNFSNHIADAHNFASINDSNVTLLPLYPRKDENVTLIVNASSGGVNSVNFTVINPTGSKVLDNVNGSRAGNLWNVTYNLTSYGTWLWNASVFYDNGVIQNSTTQSIILMQIGAVLNVSTTTTSQPVLVSGKINLSNGTNASGVAVSIYLNGTLLNGTGPSGNFTDTSDTDFNSGIYNSTNISGTGGGANLTLAFKNFTATGGNITIDGKYTIHTFTTNGTFNVTGGGGSVEYLVVAGGGGGGGSSGGGGGAGGMLTGTLSVTLGASLTVTVGAGGNGGGIDENGSAGSNSVFSSVTAIGGGYGAYSIGTGTCCGGGSGGSGGGGGFGASTVTPTTGGTGSQGSNGGGGLNGATNGAGGGGGGQGAAGANSSNGDTQAGGGGVGVSSSVSGTATFYAGGGGGGGYGPANGGNGGNGGGGGGSSFSGTQGTGGSNGGSNGNSSVGGKAGENSGGGGGSGGFRTNGGCPCGLPGGNGGSGIVIVRYLTQQYNTSGNFTSRSFDAGSSITWTNISWTNVTPVQTNLTLYYRTSSDNATWGAWSQLPGTSPVTLSSVTAHYFQYLATFNTSNTSVTPQLLEVNLSSSFLTDSYGNYNFTFTAPSSAGAFTVKVNATWASTIPGETTTTLTVTSAPTLVNQYTIPLYPRKDQNVTFYANASDVGTGISSVKFTLINPAGTKVVAGRNGSNNGADQNWNFTSYNLTAYGTWLWNISVFDNDGFIVNSTTQSIILMQIGAVLNISTTTASQPILISGKINLSNGTNASSTAVSIYLNGTLLNGTGPSGNFTDTSDSDFNSGVYNSTNISGTGGGANITLATNLTPINISVSFLANSTWTVPAGVTTVEVLVVAGGGGGGSYNGGNIGEGGGGAGGIVYNASYAVTSGSSITVTVGGGGAGATGTNGGNGSNSTFGSLTAIGGGGGGSYPDNPSSGGSGGGGSWTATGASGTSGQGNAGGNGYSAATGYGGGGGGGSNTSGSNGDTGGGGGGNGSVYTINGSSVTYAGGGGGGCRIASCGGIGGSGGGGGGGSGGAGTAGTNNTGGGGGGGGSTASGAAGGSGIVIVKYNQTYYLPTGNFTSRSFDAGASVTWTNISWANVTPVRTNLTLYYRTSSDNATWNSWSQLPSTSPVALSGVTARYLQYLATFNTSNTSVTPQLQDITLNYTRLSTDSYGNYNFTFTAPSSDGTYAVKVNATWASTIPGEQIAYLTVDAIFPTVNASANNTSPARNAIINLTANATDNNALSTGQIIVNDTGIYRYFNFSLSGASAQFSQNITVSCGRGCVINFTARVNDTVNNIRTNDTIITVANTAPATPTINFPSSNLYTSRQSLPLNITATDVDNDALTISYYINGRLNQTSLVNTTLNASDGYYILNVSVSDGAAISANATVNFTIDTVNPAVRLDTPANNTWSGASFTAAITPTDANLANCTLYHNFTGTWKANVTVQNPTSGSSNSFAAIAVSDGLFLWDAQCVDLAGNTAFNGSNFTAKIDTASPTAFNLTSPANNTISSNLTPTFTWNTTVEANFANYTLQISNGTDFQTINYTAVSMVRTEGNASLTIATDKTWHWRVIAFDQAGNNATSPFFSYTTDTTNPAVRLDSPTNNSFAGGNNRITFTFTAFDTNLKNCTLYHDYNSTSFNENQSNTTVANGISSSFTISVNESIDSSFVWNVRCYDNASNNAFNNTNFTTRVDTAAPQEFSLQSPSNNTVSSNLSPMFNWSQTVEGNFVNYTLQASNSSNFESINFTGIAKGAVSNSSANLSGALATDSIWFWRAIAFDSAGNNFTTGFFKYITDTTNPSGSFVNVFPNPAEFAFENVTVNWTAGDTNLDTAKANVTYPNGTLLANYTVNFTLATTNLTAVGNYTLVLFVNDSAGNSFTATTQLKVRDTTQPSAFSLLTPADGTRSQTLTPTLDWQDTAEADFLNYTIELSTSSAFSYINKTYKTNGSVTNSSYTLNESLNAPLNWSWRVIAYDKSNNSRTSTNALRYETFTNNLPSVPNITSPSNNSLIIFNSMNFTWAASADTDNDALTYDLLIAKDSAFTSIDLNRTGIAAAHYDLGSNTENLSDGLRYWKVRAYDGANYSNYSAYFAVTSVVAILNITIPSENFKIYSGNTTQINILEINGTSWIQNVTLEFNGTNYTSSVSGNNWSINITFSGIRSRHTNFTAYGYNLTANATAIARRTILFAKTSTNPLINYICSNETYALNSTNITVKLKASLDTVSNYSNATLTDPNNMVRILNMSLDNDELSADNRNLYRYISSYFVNLTGNYTLNATIVDIEGNYYNLSSAFYSTTAVRRINVSGNNLIGISIKDVCTGDSFANGTSIIITVPDNSLFDIELKTAKPTVLMAGVNATNTSKLLNYTDIEKNITAPSGKRIVTEFEIKSNLTFSNVTITYNYTSIASALDNENNLVMYKCPDQSSCTSSNWQLLTAALNTSRDIISTTVTNLSVFLVAETATTTTTVTNTVTTSSSGGGGGGGGATSVIMQVVKLEIILPQPAKMYLNDSLRLPVIIRNSGSTEIKNVSLRSAVDSKGMDIILNQSGFDRLKANESATVIALLSSFANLSGRTEATFTAKGFNPSVESSAKMYIELIDKSSGNKTEVVEKIKFLADLFKNNPECLELNELLKQADEASKNGEFEKAKSLTESAINSCRQLISYKGERRVVVEKPKKSVGFKISIPLLIILALIAAALLLYFSRKIKLKKPKFNFSIKSIGMKSKSKKPKSSEPAKNEEEEINRMLKQRKL